MIKRLQTKHPLLYCVLAAALFLAAMMLGINLFTLLLTLAGPVFMLPFVVEPYLLQIAQEVFGGAAAVFLLAATGSLGELARRGRGFLDGLLVGMLPFVLSCYSLTVNLVLIGPPEGAALKAPWRIAVFFIAMLMIGAAEEFLFRGVVARTLLEHFGSSHLGIWKACLLSGVVFGAGHAVNLLSSAPLGVLVQCCLTASLGILYAAIYYRTGNVWVVVFLHTLQDVAAMAASGLYEGGASIGEMVSSYDASMLIGMLFYLVPAAILLRGKRLPEIAAFSGVEPRPSGDREDSPGATL